MTKIIYLDAGHGGTDPGAVGNGLKEKDITLAVTLAVRDRLKAHGFEVLTSRTTDTNPGDASQRGAMIGKSKADYGLSIHCNSSTNTTAAGAEIIVPIQEKVGSIEKYMAEELKKIGNFRKIYSRCYDTGNTYERTFKANSNTFTTSYPSKRDYYGICRGAWTYGVSADIVELFFISNANDCANYKKQKNAYVEAIVKAICLAFNVDYKATSTQLQAPTSSSTSTTDVWYRVVVGSYSKRSNADSVKAKLDKEKYEGVWIDAFKDEKGKTWYRVIAGSYSNKTNADAVKKKLDEAGYEGVWVAVV